MAYYDNPNRNDSGDLIYWIVTIVLLVSIWPVGLFLLLRKLMGGGPALSRRMS